MAGTEFEGIKRTWILISTIDVVGLGRIDLDFGYLKLLRTGIGANPYWGDYPRSD